MKNSDKNSVLEIQATYPLLIMASMAGSSKSKDCFSDAGNDAITLERQDSSTLPTGSHESDLYESIESQKEETSKTAKTIKLVSVSFPTTYLTRIIDNQQN